MDDAKQLKQLFPAILGTAAVILACTSSVWMVNASKADTKTGAGGQPIYIYANQPAYAPAPAEPAPAPVEPAAEEEVSGKRYKQIHQYWSELEMMWKDRKEEELTAEERAAAKKLLFHVRYRFEGRTEEMKESWLDFKTKPIVQVLKEVIPECDELHEEDVTLNAQHVFRHWTEVELALFERKKRIEVLSTGKETSTRDVGTSTGDEVVIHGKEKKGKKKRILEYSLEELEAQVDEIKILLDFMTEEYGPVQKKLERLKARGMISFDLLWTQFKVDGQVTGTDEDSGLPIAMTLKSQSYEQNSQEGKFYLCSGQYIEWTGKKYVRSEMDMKIRKFRGLRKLSSLGAVPMTDSKRTELTARGRMYVQYAGVHYCNYTGEIISIKYDMMGNKSIRKAKADGRVMVDRASYRRMVPSGYGNFSNDIPGCDCSSCAAARGIDVVDDSGDADEDDEEAQLAVATQDTNSGETKEHKESAEHDIGKVSEAELCLTPPTVFGFSFQTKDWGQLLVEKFKPVEFDSNAFSHLVLEQGNKDIIRALVESTKQDNYGNKKLFNDVITGKGGGIIIVLHGSPGTGKTLTAEAVAEHLKRPLHTVSSGQLGTSPQDLEENLASTLELAEKWDCILLIDEADVFLEGRSQHEMVRNSLVAVFLRLLERYNGILILTTNRVETFDEAFISRFSIAIKYADLDFSSRLHIWKKFLSLVGVEVIEKKKKLTNGITKSEPGTPGTPATPQTAAIQDDLAGKSFITTKELDSLADEEINGRVIKQVIRAGQALALSSNEPLVIKHIKQVLLFQKRFTDEFTSAANIDYTAKDSTKNKNPIQYL